MTYPLHLLESRENGSLSSALKQVSSAAIDAAIPVINEEIQKIAAQQASAIAKMIESAIPSPSQMRALGDQISRMISSQIDQNLLPQLYKRPKTLPLGSALLSDQMLNSLYDQGISKIPTSVKISLDAIGSKKQIVINLKSIVTSAMPRAKFKELAARIDPLAMSIQKSVLPKVEDRAKDIGALVAFSGFAVGALVMFGYMKLYYSFER